MNRRRAWRYLMFAALALAAGLGLDAGWIHAKAALAQVLLERAWAHSDHGRRTQRPWPWADIAPLARLSVPRLKRNLIVLDDASGQALAFGPGWTPGSARPGTPGLAVISAHRDTQFSFLKALRLPQVILFIETRLHLKQHRDVLTIFRRSQQGRSYP